jgi:hypothetical protein
MKTDLIPWSFFLRTVYTRLILLIGFSSAAKNLPRRFNRAYGTHEQMKTRSPARRGPFGTRLCWTIFNRHFVAHLLCERVKLIR